MTKPRPLAVIRNRRLNSVALLVPLRSVQFSSVPQRTMPKNAERSRAPDQFNYVTDGHGCPMQTTSALERSVRSEHMAGCCCCLDSVVVGGFLQGRVAAVSLEVMRERDAFNQND